LWFSSALSSFLLPGTGSHPRGQLRGGGKRFGLYAHLGKQAQREGFVTVSNPQPSPPSSPSLSNGGWISWDEGLSHPRVSLDDGPTNDWCQTQVLLRLRDANEAAQ